MTEAVVTRRLTAIMFTDIVGYSALMSGDEARALGVLARQRELLPPLIASHGGILHKEMGDGALATFPSAVDALRCARAVQAVLAPESFRIRIGLHLGDVAVQGQDVFGDGVNIAARIEPLAAPGGIVMSDDFHRAVRSHADVRVHSLGPQRLKNIAEPLGVFALRDAALPAAAHVAPSHGKRWLVGAAAGVLLALASAMVILGKQGANKDASAGSSGTEARSAAATGEGNAGELPSPHAAATPTARPESIAGEPSVRQPSMLAVDDKSIAVLPFADMSPAKDQEYMSDGMAEELLNLLAKAQDLKVIARTSSFAFKGKDVPIAEIARQLGVAHVLEGSVRTSGNTLRITAQLIRAADSTHLWSETYDRPMDDIFKVQDEIAGAIAGALEIRLAGGSLDRHDGGTMNLEAYQLYLRGISAHMQNSRASLDTAVGLLERAVQIDPNFGAAWAAMASVIETKADSGWIDVREGCRRARELAQHALSVSPNNAEAHSALQLAIQLLDFDWAAAEREARAALEIDPRNSLALTNAARLDLAVGRWREAERKTLAALDRDPKNTYAMGWLALSYHLARRHEQSESIYREVVKTAPDFLWARSYHARALLAQNRASEALAIALEEPDEVARLWVLPLLLDATGQHSAADDALEQLMVHGDGLAYQVAYSFAFRGDHKRAMEWLERAYVQRDPGLFELLGDPLFDGMRGEEAFMAFLRKMNLPETPPG